MRLTTYVTGQSGQYLLAMVLEPDIERCANDDAGPPIGVDCEIPHRLERVIKHFLQGCGNFSLADAFQNRKADDDTYRAKANNISSVWA